MDKSGNFYGTTLYGGNDPSGAGTVFELTPSTPAGEWTESVLWNFGDDADGAGLNAGLIIDTSGNLYGTTSGGGTSGANGTVFELTPPSTSGGAWTESVLWNFGNGTDGTIPVAGLIMDASGNLYGTTDSGGMYNGGTVFELMPPSTVGGKLDRVNPLELRQWHRRHKHLVRQLGQG